MTNVRQFPWELELANRLIDATEAEYDPHVLGSQLARELGRRGEQDGTYSAALLEARARELIERVERSRAPQNDGQQMIFDNDAVLQLGDGRSVRLGAVEDVAQLDRAHASRTRQFAGQTTSYSAWTTSYVPWREAMIATGLPLREAIAAEPEAEAL